MKQSTNIISIGLGLFLIAATAFPMAAQQSAKSGTPAPEHVNDPPTGAQNLRRQAPQPAQELQTLTKALSGRWSIKVKFEPNSGMPGGFLGDGEETWREGPGGFTLLEEERLPTPAGDGYLLGILWWDSKTNSLHGMECNDQLPYICDLKGALNDITINWDKKQFSIWEQETHNGKKTVWHEAWSEMTPTSFTQTGDSEEEDGTRKHIFTIHGTRIAN